MLFTQFIYIYTLYIEKVRGYYSPLSNAIGYLILSMHHPILYTYHGSYTSKLVFAILERPLHPIA